MSIRKIIKAQTPDRIIRLYKESKMFPEYLQAVIDDAKIKASYPSLHFYSDEETVDMIVQQNKSLSRFGDGEIKWMCNQKLESFQAYSDELALSLRKAYKSANPNLLIGIPYGIVDSSKCSWGSKMHWRAIKKDFFSAIQDLGGLDRKFCNASITRPYMDYNDRQYSKKCFDNLKRIWHNKDICFVEGNKTKLGMGNNLFSNANSIKRILCPAVNAFEFIERIKESIRNNIDRNTLILAALGPTATILASEMCDEGYQVVDIGHIDVEYIWYLRHDLLRKPIDGKYVNESGENYQSNLYEDDENYINSVIARIN